MTYRQLASMCLALVDANDHTERMCAVHKVPAVQTYQQGVVSMRMQ